MTLCSNKDDVLLYCRRFRYFWKTLFWTTMKFCLYHTFWLKRSFKLLVAKMNVFQCIFDVFKLLNNVYECLFQQNGHFRRFTEKEPNFLKQQVKHKRFKLLQNPNVTDTFWTFCHNESCVFECLLDFSNVNNALDVV